MSVSTTPATGNVPRVLTVDEVAKRLRLNRRTVIGMVKRGELPAIRLGKVFRFDAQKIADLFETSSADRAAQRPGEQS
jgi:excisionase family DNA binding protein